MAAAPATGSVVMGSGYSFAVPEGWTVPEEPPLPELDSMALNPGDTDGFSDNVNVVLSPMKWITPGHIESMVVGELERSGARDVRTRTRLMIAGAASAHLSAVLSSEGVDYVVEQYFVCTDEQTFVVTFSFSTTVPELDRDILSESVLASWLWA